MRRYVYRGDRATRPDLRGARCEAVLDGRGKCVRGRNGSMLVKFDAGDTHVVLARQLRREDQMARKAPKKSGPPEKPRARRGKVKLAQLADPTGERVVIEFDPARIDTHPSNPRGAMSTDTPHVVDLAWSIQTTGQHQPILVRQTCHERHQERYQVLVGHRRLLACQRLQRTVLGVLIEADDAMAERIVLGDACHERPDLLAEAEMVTRMKQAHAGWTARDVADQLGRPLSWVATRLRLHEALSDDVRRLLTDGPEEGDPQRTPDIREWPAEWLLELAKVPSAEQISVLRSYAWSGARGVAGIRDRVGDYLRRLASTPWNLDDETLVPEAGACSACLKTSARSPGLFDDWTDAPENPRGALCLDTACWESKRSALLKREAERITAERGQRPVIVAESSRIVIDRDMVEEVGAAAKEVFYESEAKVLKRAGKDAIPALRLGDDGSITPCFVRPENEYGRLARHMARGTAMAAAEPGDVEDVPQEETAAAKLERAREKLAARRAAHAIDAARAMLEQIDPPDLDYVVELILVYGCEAPERVLSARDRIEMHARLATASGLSRPDDAASELWRRVLNPILDATSRAHIDQDRFAGVLEEIEVVFGVIDLMQRYRDILAAAAEDIPAPKSLARLERDAEAEAAAAT